MSISSNFAISVLNDVNTKSIFSGINKRHKKDIKCNLLLLQVKNQDDSYSYAIEEFNEMDNTTLIREPSEDEKDYLIKILLLDGDKVCKYDINKDYLKDAYFDCDMSFVLFSKHVDTRTRTLESIVNVCGILFLNVINKANGTKNLYIELVCSEARSEAESSGLGTKFMNLCDEIGRKQGFQKILLSAIDKPLGFYLSKGFRPVKGSDLYEIPEDIRIPIFKRGKLLQSNLPKTAMFSNNMGMYTSFTNATRLLPKGNRSNLRTSERESAGRKFLGDGTISGLSGVKISRDEASNMVVMEKNVNSNTIVAMGKSHNKKKLRQTKRKKPNSLKKKKRKKTSKK